MARRYLGGIVSSETPLNPYNDSGAWLANDSYSGFLYPPVAGQIAYTTPGSYLFTVPNGVESICAVLVGGGGGGTCNTTTGYYQAGGGGGLRYINNYPVFAGQVISVIVGAGGVPLQNADNSRNGFPSSLVYGGNTLVYAGGGAGGIWGTTTRSLGGTGTAVGVGPFGGTIGGGDGGSTRTTSTSQPGGGGGAGGYSGTGGTGGFGTTPGTTGTGGAGGGGGRYAGGGGVGLLGEGASGAGGAANTGGGGGSGGGAGIITTGGAYGGGAGAITVTYQAGLLIGGSGAVRIIWGANRSFPSTNTGDV